MATQHPLIAHHDDPQWHSASNVGDFPQEDADEVRGIAYDSFTYIRCERCSEKHVFSVSCLSLRL